MRGTLFSVLDSVIVFFFIDYKLTQKISAIAINDPTIIIKYESTFLTKPLKYIITFLKRRDCEINTISRRIIDLI